MTWVKEWQEKRWLKFAFDQVENLVNEEPGNLKLLHLMDRMEGVIAGDPPYRLEMDEPTKRLYARATAVYSGVTLDVEQCGATPPTPPPTRVEQVEQSLHPPPDPTPHSGGVVAPPGIVLYSGTPEATLEEEPPDNSTQDVEQGGAVEQLLHPPPPPHLTCPTCNKIFSRPYNLKRHRKTHSNEKTHSCKHCSKTFTRSDSKKRHEGHCEMRGEIR